MAIDSNLFMNTTSLRGKHRLTQARKDANDKQWYKEQADLYDSISLNNNSFTGWGEISDYKRMKVNYDLFNNQINLKDFAYVCQPFGAEVGELPANFTNRDITSGKIKVLLGMEMKMPFDWRVIATNEEATTRKEEEQFGRIRDYVVSEAMKPIQIKAQMEMKAKMKGKDLNPQEIQDLQRQMEEEIETKTPDKVSVYMSREHQDPAEALSRQLLQYLIPAKRLPFKFNKGWKHSNLSGNEIYWVGILNDEPDVKVVNPLFFDYDKSPDTDFIEDGEWATCEYRMTPSEVIANFGSELTPEQIDKVYSFSDNISRVADADFTFTNNNNDGFTVRVLHVNFKSLKLVKILTYLDESKKPQEMLVDENYQLNKKAGDLKIEREWIPESHEVYKILDDIYVHARPVPGQEKDLDNLWETKLSYFGAACDSLNSPTTAPMDRLKTYQYFYNIIIYRMELLMASDKGKILLANIHAIPKKSGIDVSKFQYFMEANKIAYLDPNQEGNKGWSGNMEGLAKVVDMGLVGDITRYMQIAEFINRAAGASIGVTPQMEAQIAAGEAVTNTQQNLVQSSYMIQPYFELHSVVKGNVLNAFLDQAKIAYSRRPPQKLSYVLDDMSLQMLTTDPNLLENSKYGLFVANSAKAADAKRAVENLSQAALQNQQADLNDIIKILKADSVNEAEELLEAAQIRKSREQQEMEKAKLQHDRDTNAAIEESKDKDHQREIELIIIKEGERRKTELQKQAMLSVGFDPNKDEDNDGEPDVLEIYKHGLNVEIQNRKINLEENKFNHQQQTDKKKLEQQDEKLAIDRKKAAKQPTSKN